MTDTGQQPERVEVTQADREAAAEWISPNSRSIAQDICDGLRDAHALVKRFARHRLTALTEAGRTLDLEKLSWQAISEAASRSNWMPPEYMVNDWVADVCQFVEHGTGLTEADRAGVEDGLQAVLAPIRTRLQKDREQAGYQGSWAGQVEAASKLLLLDEVIATLAAARKQPVQEDHRTARTVENLRRALVWHGDSARMATTREAWQQDVDDAVAWVNAHPEDGLPSRPTLALPPVQSTPTPDVEER